jgi:hypothetical protein
VSKGKYIAVIVLVGAIPSAAAAEEECAGIWPIPDWCFPDIICPAYEGYWDLRRSVVQIYGPDINGTGVLINNYACSPALSKDNDCGVPYILTAYHVASSGMGVPMTQGQRIDIQAFTTFSFGLEAATCGGSVATSEVALGGAVIVAESVEKDLLLLKLSTRPPAEVGAYYLGWGMVGGGKHVAITHPCGGFKRIAIADDGATSFQEAVGRDLFIVAEWADGALAAGSSGGPLIESATGSLMGIFTDVGGAGAYACYDPSLLADDRFTAITSILEFLPFNVAGGASALLPYDSNPDAGILDVVKNSQSYGPGEVVTIDGHLEVYLLDGFHAISGSQVTVRIQP